jgi:hypothetical protein
MAGGIMGWSLGDGEVVTSLAPAVWLGLAGLAMVGYCAWARHRRWRQKVAEEDRLWEGGGGQGGDGEEGK